jgi:hypothetical protein
VWSYCTTTYNATKAVVFDFADSGGGQHARHFLGLPSEDGWHGKLVCAAFMSAAQMHACGCRSGSGS